MSKARLHLLAWLLIVATFAAAVLPPFVHVYLHGHDDALSFQACAHQGVKLIQVPSLVDEVSSEQAPSQLEHCPFCMQHACHALPAVIAFGYTAETVQVRLVPPQYLWIPRSVIAWMIPASRAPPSQQA